MDRVDMDTVDMDMVDMDMVDMEVKDQDQESRSWIIDNSRTFPAQFNLVVTLLLRQKKS